MPQIESNPSPTLHGGVPLVAGLSLNDQSQAWYAIYTASRHEKKVNQHLQSREVESFLPLYSALHRWKNGCKVNVELPLFPGYLFVRINQSERIRVLEVPGVLTLVGRGREAVALPDSDIHFLRSGLQLRKCELHPYLAIGQKVRVKAGPMAGLEGLLVRKTNGLRVVITLDLIKQSVAVQVDACDVEPITPAN